MSPEAISILKKRLANGEINLEQYNQLLATISKPSVESIDVGSFVESLDDLQVFTKGLISNGKKYLYSDIYSVHCSSHDARMNGISFARNSYFLIKFNNDDYIEFDESGRFFKGGRHKKINQISQYIKNQTKEIRYEKFTKELTSAKRILIGFTEDRNQVFLTRNGDLECPNKNLKFNIKNCHLNGTLALGVETSTLNSNSIDPDLIAISNLKRSLLKFPKDSLKFTLHEPTDIAMFYLKIFQTQDYV